MGLKERFDVKIKLKQIVAAIVLFFKRNALKVSIITGVSLLGVLLTSFSVFSSSLAQVDSTSIICANIAKDNSYQKVHLASRLHFYDDGSFTENSANNGKVFTDAHRMANQSFIKYSSAAFLTRNNFYNVPIVPNSDDIEYVTFEYSFLNTTLSLMNITPSTNSEIVKTYTTQKYVDGALVDNYQAKKTRLETMDLYLLQNEEKTNSGFPLFLPDYVAKKIVEENVDISSLNECIGLAGTINVSGITNDVYIKNIIVTSQKTGDPNDLNDCDFTEGNVRFSKFLMQLYGDYSLMFFSPMYSQNRCLTCADFDSELFKIKSYIKNDLAPLYSINSSTSVFSFELEDDSFVLQENHRLSELISDALIKNNKKGYFSYFDGSIWSLLLGILFSLASLVLLFVLFGKNNNCDIYDSRLLFSICVVPILALNSLSLLFLFFFSARQMFVAFCFASLSVVSLILFIAHALATLVIYFIRRHT